MPSCSSSNGKGKSTTTRTSPRLLAGKIQRRSCEAHRPGQAPNYSPKLLQNRTKGTLADKMSPDEVIAWADAQIKLCEEQKILAAARIRAAKTKAAIEHETSGQSSSSGAGPSSDNGAKEGLLRTMG